MKILLANLANLAYNHDVAQTIDTPDTIAQGEETIRTQLRIPTQIWDRMKIQAIHEKTTAEALTSKAFEMYLASEEARSKRVVS